jgi:hypothetical protein
MEQLAPNLVMASFLTACTPGYYNNEALGRVRTRCWPGASTERRPFSGTSRSGGARETSKDSSSVAAQGSSVWPETMGRESVARARRRLL